MRLPSLQRFALTAVVALIVGVAAQQLLASTPTVKGKGKVFQVFHAVATMSTFLNDVVLVPDKQTLVVTDVIIANNSASANSVAVRCNSGSGVVDLLPLIPVAAGTAFQHGFSAGIECPAGTTLRLESSATSGNVKVALSGYFRKGS